MEPQGFASGKKSTAREVLSAHFEFKKFSGNTRSGISAEKSDESRYPPSFEDETADFLVIKTIYQNGEKGRMFHIMGHDSNIYMLIMYEH